MDDPPIEHVALQVKAPPLTHLTNAELSNLRSYLQKQGRDARKAANKVIMKDDKLKPLLLKTLSFKSGDPLQIAAREEFEAELVRYPEAFTRYAIANAYVFLDQGVREESLKRAATAPVMARRR